MNKSMMWIMGTVVIVLVGGGFLFVSQQSKQSEEEKIIQKETAMTQQDTTSTSLDDTSMKKTDDTMMQKTDDRYVVYSKEALDKAAGNRRVLFFYANWCPTCRPADADFTTNKDKIPSDVTVVRVNYNDSDTDQEEQDLAKQYGVTYQHTFVQIDQQGKQVGKWNGGKLEELLATIK